MLEFIRPCIRRGSQGLFLMMVLVCAMGSARAQSGLIAAWGIHAGYSASPTAKGVQVDAFYDIPIGHVYFSPGGRVMFSDNSMFSVETRIRFPLVSNWLLLGFGGSVMIWEDRASIGVPVEVTAPIDLASRVQLNTGISATPHFFFGKEKDGVMMTGFIGLRFPLL